MIDFIKLAQESGYLCFDAEHEHDTKPFRPEFKIHGCGFASLKDGEIVAEYVTDLNRVRDIISATFLDPKIQIIAHNGKYDLNCLKRANLYPGDPVNFRDTMVAQNLLNENIDPKQLGLKPTIERLYGYKMKSFTEAASKGLDDPQFKEYAEDDAHWELKLYLDSEPKLKPFWDLFTNIMMPSVLTFSDVECFGLRWNIDKADEFYVKLYKAREELRAKIHKKIGRLNMNSDQQLAQRLFGELGYTTKYTEKGKSGVYSVSAEVMDRMSKKYPVCNWIRAYRSCNKLIGTYLEPAMHQYEANEDNRIHSSYWLVSLTGRTRSSDLNNQNFPARVGSDLGALSHIFEDVKIREACDATPGHKLIVADFSQIELRLAAHIMKEPDFIRAYCEWQCFECGDNGSDKRMLHTCPTCNAAEHKKAFALKKHFWQGRDLHTEVLDYVPASIRSQLNRDHGKVLNFAILYNAGGWRLHHEHPMLSPEQWQKAIDTIMKNRPMAKKYHKNSESLLKRVGHRDTIFGRRRRIPREQYTVNGKVDYRRFKHALNEFVNSPIQGPGSTLCQLAMIKLRRHWISKGWWGTEARIVNMIHDELVVEAKEEVADQVLQDTIYWMENAATINVPIRAEGGIYDNWAEAK